MITHCFPTFTLGVHLTESFIDSDQMGMIIGVQSWNAFFLAPYKRGEKPDPAPVHWLTDDENFSDAPELDTLGKVFDQDVFNMGKVQLGLETTQKTGVVLSNYQESKVRWLHHKLSEWCEEEK